MKNTFYITTPIYYVTARPHLGSLYSTVLADVLARWHALRGSEVFFLTGTDEHGQKIAQAAAQAGKTPQDFVDSFIDAYKKTWQQYEIGYSRFIRTTEQAHITAVQNWLRRLIAQGDVYKSTYKGWYCTPCETFVNGDNEPACPDCNRSTVIVSEDSYFFKLSAYQERLLEFYAQHPDFITPKERLNEVKRFVSEGLNDLCISRTTVKWGVPFPDDSAHVVYVWVDALLNYLTGVGFDGTAESTNFLHWWPAQLQVLGKDIVRFHAVYWPAFLMATGLPVPQRLLVHGWIKMGDMKMSKSLGNVVEPQVLAEQYGVEPVRYYLMSQMAVTQDSPFSIEDLEKRISADLANSLGNLLNRVVTLALNNGMSAIPEQSSWGNEEQALCAQACALVDDVQQYMANGMTHLACAKIFTYVGQVNAYVHAQEPWKVVKADRERFGAIVSAVCHALRVIGTLLWPVMPTKMGALLGRIGQEVHQTLGTDLISGCRDAWTYSFQLSGGDPLFVKIEPAIAHPECPVKPQAEAGVSRDLPVPGKAPIGFEDFTKIELVVGTIVQCEEVPKSDKLLKLQVDFGPKGKRQVLSGVKQHFAPADLIGTQGVFVLNLKPRAIMGLESQGMMLFAPDANGKLQRITVASEVPGGAIVG